MAKIKLTKNELKVQKDALKMYQRYLPTLTLKKQQLQAEIRTIELKAIAVRKEKSDLEKDFDAWIAVFGEMDAFPEEGIMICMKLLFGLISQHTTWKEQCFLIWKQKC